MGELKGLMVYVYRTNYDATNGGVTSSHDRVLLVGEGVPEVFKASDDLPALRLVKRIIGGNPYLHAEPIEKHGKHHMFGGNFIYVSDSRFPNRYPIPVHDRTE